MKRFSSRVGMINPVVGLGLISIVALIGIGVAIWINHHGPGGDNGASQTLVVYCAAGMRPAMTRVVELYESKFDVKIELQFGGSNTLLSQIELAKSGDIYLAGDSSYVEKAKQKGLVREDVAIGFLTPVIAVAKGNPKQVKTAADLLDEKTSVAVGNPEMAAIGKKTRKLLTAGGQWEALEKKIQNSNGVFKPTVPDVALDVASSGVDAGIIWDATARQYETIDLVHVPELDRGRAQITMGVLTSAQDPTRALHFARFVAAADRGLNSFKALGYEVVDGDAWADKPEITLFAGAVNSKALEPIIDEFSQREGVVVNTVYNGCGILTGQMRAMVKKKQSNGFPDAYMACDVFYLDTVADLFRPGVNVSHTNIVLVTPKANAKKLTGIQDLLKPGVRVGIGQPEQCTIGVLTKKLLQSEGIYDKLMASGGAVVQVDSSAKLIPMVAYEHADAVFAYHCDTLAEQERLHVIPIKSPLARAVQPYSIAKSSRYPALCQRLFATIAAAKGRFEEAGFLWQLDPDDAKKFLAPKSSP